MKSLATLLFFLTVISSQQLFGQAGNLDSTFSSDGIVITPIGNNHDVAFSVQMQPDGKIVAVGNTKSGDYDFALTRYNSDGSVDGSFGVNGIVITDITGSNDHALFGAVRPNGKIVAAGRAYMGVGPEFDFAVAQYNSDGTLDANFGTNGTVTTPIGAGSDEGYGMALQSDGKIVVAGFAFIDPPQGFDKDFAVIRYDSTGIPDNTFGTNGIVTTDFDTTIESAHDVEIQSNGRILGAGEISISGQSDFAVARYDADGTPDVSWDNDGKVTTALGNNAYAFSMALQEDGKVVVAGHIGDLPNADFVLVRYNKDGSIDSTFGIDGVVITDIAGSDDECFAVILQPDLKILAAGHASIGVTQRFAAVVRYNADGSLDLNFGTGGIVMTALGNTDDEYRGMTLQQDGKIVVCGYSNNQSNNDFAVARYLSDLALDVLDFSAGENSVFIFPNPIQTAAELEYALTKDEMLSIALYDVEGKLVQSFISNEKRTTGKHKEQLQINENLPAGNYVLTLSNGSHKISVKMVKL